MTTIQIVPQHELDRLLTKQWHARIYLKSCPLRRALNLRWKYEFAKRKRVAAGKEAKGAVYSMSECAATFNRVTPRLVE